MTDTLVTVSPGKWRAALRFLTGQVIGISALSVTEKRTLKRLYSGQAFTSEQAHSALKRLGWALRHGHETEFLTRTAKQQEWEEAIFRNATHFTVFRLHRRTSSGTMPQRESTAYHTFPEATAQAADDVQALVYAVTGEGNNFCIPRGEWERYKTIWSER